MIRTVLRIHLVREWLLVAVIAAGLVGTMVRLDLTERADNLVYDLFAGLRTALPSNITIVAIDERSLAAIGRWPWPRAVHARLLERLAAAQPAAIGYDVLFIEPSGQDAALARAMTANGDVVLPMTFTLPGNDGAAFDPELPAAPLARAARVGHAILLPDPEGIVRRISLRAGSAAQSWAAFAEMIYRQTRGTPSPAYLRSAEATLPGRAFGLSPPLLMPTSRGNHPTVSFVSVLRGEVPPEILHGRVLLIGSTVTGSGDRQPVAGGVLPGVEVTADLVDALMQDRFVRQAGLAAGFASAFLPLGLVLAGLLRLSPRANLILGIATLASLLAGSAICLMEADFWLPPVAGMAGVLLVHPLWAWRRLTATSNYMLRELGRLQAEPDPLPTTVRPAIFPTSWLDDQIDRQKALLENAVQRVRDLRRFFAESLQGLPDATVIIDGAERVLLANRAAEQLFGAVALGARQDMAETVAACFASARLPAAVDYEVELATADDRTFILRRKPFTTEDGEAIGAILSFVDVTASRLVTRQREEAIRLLSHDMRAPQAAILALIEQDGDARTRERIAAYARRTMRLAEQFVLLTRAESSILACALLNLAALLVEAADELWPIARSRQVRVETPDETDDYLVFGDRSLLLRMFINVIDNAIRYAPAGTVVCCTIEQADAAHCCRIADEGPGIPEQALDAIFRPFDRAGRTDTGGTGLGLAFVQAVAGRHGGSVSAANAPSGGAVLTITLPAAYDPPADCPWGSSASTRAASEDT